jgi:hypothetical protein
MRLSILVSSSLVSALAVAAPKLAVPEWNIVGLSPELGSFYAGEVARVLRREGLTVITAKDIAAVLGLDRQRKLLGCESGTDCMAELGAALGCDGVVTVNLARLDDGFRGTLRVSSARDGATLAEEVLVAKTQGALADALEVAAVRLARTLKPPPPTSVRSWAWLPLAGGLALGAGGAACLGFAGGDYSRMTAAGSAQEGARLRDEGQGLQTAGWALAGTGVAALIATGLVYFLGGPDASVSPAVSAAPSGLSVGVAGSWR